MASHSRGLEAQDAPLVAIRGWVILILALPGLAAPVALGQSADPGAGATARPAYAGPVEGAGSTLGPDESKRRGSLLDRLRRGRPGRTPRERIAPNGGGLPNPEPTLSRPDPAVGRTYFQDPGPSPSTRSASADSEADRSFAQRLFEAYFDEEPDAQAEGEPAQPRRIPPAPFQAPPFPFAEHLGPVVGVRDDSVWPLMEALEKGPRGDRRKDRRIKIYGWIDPSVNFSTSHKSNIPESYDIYPDKLELSQAIVIFERTTDSNQKDNMDWGFKFTNLYGIDYRYTTAKGYFSDQLLKHNHLYGYDPLQMYVDLYFPKVAQGMIVRMGRYISPIDIEAQLSPENYLYSHSVMYTYDPYTFTGVQFITKLNDRFTLQLGAHAGNDMAPWTTSSQPNGEILLKWTSEDNKDALFGGVDSVGRGYFKNGHDDLQIASILWTHKFNETVHTLTEGYYLWQRHALAGGSVTNGPPKPYFEGVGPGKLIPGLSNALGVVNYTPFKLSEKAYIVLRNDCLADFQGQRTGIATTYFEHTIGYVRHLTDWCIFRPEARFEYTSGAKAYDNGTRREQFTLAADMIIRF